MRVILQVVAGPHKGLEFAFDRHDTFLVGRSKHAHFQLPAKDKYFSRIHFMMEVNPPECRLIDMGSHNGTFVNGAQVLTADLKDGDQIRAGHTVLRLAVERSGALPGAVSFHAAAPGSKGLPTIPGYTLDRELGRGAMGITYLARSAPGAPPVAVKVVQPSFPGTKEQIDAFLKSARNLTQLDHPHIARLHEVGACPYGLYFVSEYVVGANAAEIVKRDGPLAIKRGVQWGNQILLSLQYAHGRNYIHYDLKPSNILIASAGDKEVVKLGDYALARVYQAAPFSGLGFTAALLAQASFVPPEMLFNYQDVNPLADQYSAAAVIYYLLTGDQVLDLPKEGRRRFTSLLRRQQIPIRERRPDISASLAEVLHKALARTPAQRHANAGAFRQALMKCLSET